MWKLARRKNNRIRRSASMVLPPLEGLEERALMASFKGLGVAAPYIAGISEDGKTIVARVNGGPWGSLDSASGAFSVFDYKNDYVKYISSSGYFVTENSQGQHFLWTEDGKSQLLSSQIDWNGFSAISRDGKVATGFGYAPEESETPGEPYAFRWTESGGTSVIATDESFGPGGKLMSVDGISADGNVVIGTAGVLGSTETPGVEGIYIYPFKWEGGAISLIGEPQYPSIAYITSAVSPDGSAVIGERRTVNRYNIDRYAEYFSYQQFAWSSEHVEIFGPSYDVHDWWPFPSAPPPPGVRFVSSAVSNGGSTVVGALRDYSSGNPVDQAAIWTKDGGFRFLEEKLVMEYGLSSELAGWTLGNAAAVTPDGGTIVGMGINPAGQQELWIAELDKILPDIQTSFVTAKDTESVIVEYEISDAQVTKPIKFSVYRSATEYDYSNADEIGSYLVSDLDLLSIGKHRLEIQVAENSLSPNANRPYVTIDADSQDSINESDETNNSGHFRKLIVGIIAHGLTARFDQFWDNYRFGGLPIWVREMAISMRQTGQYDDVIEFNWVEPSRNEERGVTIREGVNLYKQIMATRQGLLQENAGDVIDYHFIGHSRGSVIISQAIETLNNTGATEEKSGYIQMTMLDPHPARNYFARNKAFFDSPIPGLSKWKQRLPDFATVKQMKRGILLEYNNARGLIPLPNQANSLRLSLIIEYLEFQNIANDPEIVIPEIVDRPEVYFQRTPARKFRYREGKDETFYRILSLWGEDPSRSNFNNKSGESVLIFDLTNKNIPGFGRISHTLVPVYYREFVVKNGSMFN